LLEVFDSRGYSVLITKHHRAGKYSASIYFPHWPKKHTEKELLPFSPGVSKREYTWGDVFIGSAESLIEAGIIKRENLPGQPGMRKMRVTLRPDGTAKTSARRDDQPGTRIIERASGSTYAVSLLVSEAESDRRKSEERAADEQWRRKIHSLRRPAMLRPLVATAIAELKSAIAAAARDEHFQGWLLRIISEPIPGSSSKPRTT